MRPEDILVRTDEVAIQLGTTMRAIRFYEKLGLLQLERGFNRRRLFTPSDIRMLQFILDAKALGFTLEEIKPAVVRGRYGMRPHFTAEEIQSKRKEILAKRAAIDRALAQLGELEPKGK